MSKAEHMGISPSRVSCHAKTYSSPEPSTPEQAHEFNAESKCNGLSEQRHQSGSEVIQAENGDTGSTLIQHGATETEHAINYLLTDLYPPPEDAFKSNQSDKFSRPKLNGTDQKPESCSEGMPSEVGVVCALIQPSTESKSMVFQKESTGTTTVPPSCLGDDTLQLMPVDVAQNTLTEDLVLPLEDKSKYNETDKFSCYHRKPSSELMQNEQNEASSGLSRCVSIEHLGPFPGSSTGASIGHLSLPSDVAMNIAAADELQASHDVDKCSIVEQLEIPFKDVVTNSSCMGRRVKSTPKSVRKKYILRSFKANERVLRSRSHGEPKAPGSSNNLPSVSPGGEKKRKKHKKRRGKRIIADEYSRIWKDLRYSLNRISYEQSLITAYSGEGWKGLSLEKLKPEKELERASSEIFRRKLKIRDLFERIDSLCDEGKLPPYLFDSEGQIDSEDIFCAKCGSKDLTADNDIILCDGACDRGFHQFCLLPPMLKEDIPPDDEGWLCPGCDCKIDCIDLLNEFQGTNLSISDTWQKVFPEAARAAAAAAAGGNLDHNFGLPSGDSDDNDYKPEGPDLDEKSQGDEASSDESDFTSASDGLEAKPADDQYLGLPSDDSEDDDYDPGAPDLEENTKQEDSSSDFTSDSEDLAASIDNNELLTEDQSHASIGSYRDSDLEPGGRKNNDLNRELLCILRANSSQNGLALVSGKRNIERLDYKQLYDETYGNVSSDSSGDEDFNGAVGPRKRRKRSAGGIVSMKENGNVHVTESGMSAKDTKQDVKETEPIPKGKTSQNSNFENKHTSPVKAHEGIAPSTSCGTKVRSSTYRRLGEAITQRLYNSFKENQYPDRATKKSLADELGLTFQQVDKWFGNTRWSFNHSSINSGVVAEATSEKDPSVHETDERVLKPVHETVIRDATNNVSPGKESPEVFAAAAAESCCGDVKKSLLHSQRSGKRKSKTIPKSRRR